MAKSKKLKEQTIFTSNDKPKSAILNKSFIQRLNSLFGFRTTQDKENAENEFEKKYGIKFVRVDLNNPSYRVHNAALGSVFQSQNLNQNLERYFDAYLNETSMSYDDIQDRQKRLNELTYAYCNDPFINRVCHLAADEATQLDVQDRIISIESPNPTFVEHTYSLLNRWGITQARVNAVCFDLELYGESFWTHKVGLNGIEKIMPLKPNSIMERLEFSPVHMANYLAERDGWNTGDKSRGAKISELVDLLKGKGAFEDASNLADMFDSKLLGYELEGGLVAPPWMVTHFRYNADHSEFYPYGRPPLIGAIAPFKQAHSTMALQGLARSMSFPVTMYKVKATEGMLPAQAFDVVNQVREQYDNIGVTPSTEGSEVYTVNTKIWVPSDLLDIDVKESKCDFNFVDDLENYQNRVAIACGVPKGYLDPTADAFGESGVSLVEQYKPFARHVYTIQSAFLDGLGELIRMHYAITGEFDYNTPFVLSMRFPAEELTDSKRSAQSASIDLSKAIIELIQTVLGLEEGEPLPEDVVTDILSKYTFLNPTDIQKWLKLTSFAATVKSDNGEDGDDDSDDEGGDDMEESKKRNPNLGALREARKQRLREISESYKGIKDDIYMRFIESNHLTDWRDTTGGKHNVYIPQISESSVDYETFKVLKKSTANGVNANLSGYDRLREDISLNSVLKTEVIRDKETRSISDALKEAAAENIGAKATSEGVLNSDVFAARD